MPAEKGKLNEQPMTTARTIPVETLAERIAAGVAPAILDVRSSLEFARGHVPGARHIPFWVLPFRVDELEVPRTEELVVYCGHGPRAWMAGAVLRRAGFERVSYLAGHFEAWRAAGGQEEREE